MINGCAVTIVVQIIQKLSLYFGKEMQICGGGDGGDGKIYFNSFNIYYNQTENYIETAELDFSIVSIVFDSQSENYCNN